MLACLRACLAWFGLPWVVSAASYGVVLAGLCEGRPWMPFWGHFPAPLGRLKNAQKTTHNTTEICDLGSSLEGLLGAQKRHLEITDSSPELCQKVLWFLFKKSRLRNRIFIRFRETFVKFWPSGCSFLGLFGRQFFGKMCRKPCNFHCF